MRLFLLVGLFLAATSASRAAATAGVVVARDGVEVTILPTVAPGGGPDGTIEVAIDLEARTDDAARRLGFHSLHGVTTFDCRQGVNRFSEAKAYDQADLKGDGRVRAVSGAWGRPAPDSIMSAVTERVCGGAPSASGPAMIVTAAPSPDASGAQATPAAQPATATEKVALVAPPTRAALPLPAPSASTRPPVLAVAQVAASATAKSAQGVLNALHALIAPPLAGSVEPAVVGGAKVYRANVAGFASVADARAFCSRVASVLKTCWVRLPSPR